MENIDVPLSRLEPLGDGSVITRKDAVILVTSSSQWAYSAEAEFELPAAEQKARMVEVRLRVQSGTIGVGWLRQDGSSWIERASCNSSRSTKLDLLIPAGTLGGKLVFDNWTEGGEPAVGVLEGIQIAPAPVYQGRAEKHHRAGLAEEEHGNRDSKISRYRAE